MRIQRQFGTVEAMRLDQMVDRVEFPSADAAAPQAPEAVSPKKPFVAPRISVPVDVLEATTFFQSVESGATN
jgi:hypothetical protein